MKIQVAAFLLVLLAAAELSEALDFFDKHVVRNMRSEDCNRKMKRINYANCKGKNTFILDPEGELNSICSSGQMKEMITSEFIIVDCVHKKTSRFPNCLYNGEDYLGSYIEVECVNGRPTHLQNLARSLYSFCAETDKCHIFTELVISAMFQQCSCSLIERESGNRLNVIKPLLRNSLPNVLSKQFISVKRNQQIII
uniref:Ribonuclease A-domain domain-containing protein n=1 Tax=Poecilia mexicana TaxID=48701 RepID=A0A3B3X0R3_9TELE